MKAIDNYLSPTFDASGLDLYFTRNAILRALKENLERLSGTLLDIGCGYMPYRTVIVSPPSRVVRYIGMDLHANTYQKPELEWDGRTIPLREESIDCALATEVFEHCPDPQLVMREAYRVLRTEGILFFTVPFLWPLHDVPHDEYRFTPFALERHLRSAGFADISMQAQGGWDASLAQMIGLWVRRRPLSPLKRALLSRAALPVVRYLAQKDDLPDQFDEGTMITGLTGTARKPSA